MEMNLTHFVHNLLNLKGHKSKAPRIKRWCSLIRNFSFVFDRKKGNFEKALCNKFLLVNKGTQNKIWTKLEKHFKEIPVRSKRMLGNRCWNIPVSICLFVKHQHGIFDLKTEEWHIEIAIFVFWPKNYKT